MKILYLSIILCIFFSCTQQKKENDVTIELKEVSLFLTDYTGEGDLPPILYLTFNFENNSDSLRFFSSKPDKLTKSSKSTLLLLDTIQNKITPVYVGDLPIIHPHQTTKLTGEIKLRDNKDFFHLSDTFFSKKDFDNDYTFLSEVVEKTIKNSIIIYNQDDADSSLFKFFNHEVTPIGNDKILKVRIPSTLKITKYDQLKNRGKLENIDIK
ncbi:hypothetical protein E6C50_12940 [Flavobacterium supellecticarium]|uniref:Lipoprotein n=1 Tax=Flavobacterium supellecticarium TaxID=2565924 RepID=A0A4S3ZU11_9FLAO|nr:hypothetical protein [Flavobacterium supellecticarium]THF49145.1 hypothetical protein E6C50_12940 [Flavobacterium supellecticarium]